MSRIAELEAKIAELQAELAAAKCREHMPSHITHGTICERENDGHKWHETHATHNAINGVFVIRVKWNSERIDSE